MTAKQTRPHSPAGTRLEGPDREGNYTIVIRSESRPLAVYHRLSVAYDGTPLGCSCEGHAAFLRSRERHDCWHMGAAADLLAYHLDPPPADPGDEHKPAGSAEYDPDPGGVCPRCLGSGAMLDGDDRPYPCERCEGVGRVAPRDPADPGGAALDAAQADADDEADAWEAELRRVRHDEGLRALYGPS
jgi:hypothetical protein